MQEYHQMIKPISSLIGSWLSKKAHGEYPTMKSFDYKELVEITHPAPHQPILHLKFTSWFENTETNEKKYAHFETGFLKAKPNSSPLYLCYTSSHNNGLTLIEEGIYNDTTKLISLDSTHVGRTSMNNPPAVLKTKKEIKINDPDHMSIKMFMETSTNLKLDEHLFVEYERIK